MDGFWSLGPFLIPITAIAGGILAGIVATVTRARVRELEIRERIAMIERGMVPPPESDPEGFDRRMQSMDRLHRGHVAPRHRSAGIVLIAVGLGMAVTTILGFVAIPSSPPAMAYSLALLYSDRSH